MPHRGYTSVNTYEKTMEIWAVFHPIGGGKYDLVRFGKRIPKKPYQ